MSSNRFSRRRFVRAGVASTVGAAVALEAASRGRSAGSESDIVVGHFRRARGPRSAVVQVIGGGVVGIELDEDAFVAHGADGIVDDVTQFVPGEEVAVRGVSSGGEIAAVELQSVYTSVTGSLITDGNGHRLDTSAGPVRIPAKVLRAAPAPKQPGATFKATIWTNPQTGEATALDLEAT